jgi:hypothetical protein
MDDFQSRAPSYFSAKQDTLKTQNVLSWVSPNPTAADFEAQKRAHCTLDNWSQAQRR